MKALNTIALVLLIIGGLNWGLLGLFNIDVVAAIFGGSVGPRSEISRVVYVVVGLAAIYGIYMLRPLLLGTGLEEGTSTRTTTGTTTGTGTDRTTMR